ncbi:MAG: type II secretion system protein [Candidatus Babeliales bacterium]|jgi:type II secretory pathway pseudopilin PulG
MRNAFTLLEMLVVITITIILCAITIHSFGDDDRTLILQELEKMEVILRYLQQRAMATQRVQSLVITTTAQTYSYGAARQILPPRICFGYLATAYGPPGNPTAPLTHVATFPAVNPTTFILKIFPNGKMSSGALYMRNYGGTRLGALTCTVSQVSYLRKYMYDSGQWVLLAS